MPRESGKDSLIIQPDHMLHESDKGQSTQTCWWEQRGGKHEMLIVSVQREQRNSCFLRKNTWHGTGKGTICGDFGVKCE